MAITALLALGVYILVKARRNKQGKDSTASSCGESTTEEPFAPDPPSEQVRPARSGPAYMDKVRLAMIRERFRESV